MNKRTFLKVWAMDKKLKKKQDYPLIDDFPLRKEQWKFDDDFTLGICGHQQECACSTAAAKKQTNIYIEPDANGVLTKTLFGDG